MNKHSASMFATMVGMSMFDSSIYSEMGRRFPEVPEPKKCLRPSCEELTNHNKGYCSACCCKAHRAEIKEDAKRLIGSELLSN